MLPALAAVFRRRKRPVGTSWWMEKPTSRSAASGNICTGRYAAPGHNIDLHGVPEKITVYKSGANTAATVGMRVDCGADIEMCQLK